MPNFTFQDKIRIKSLEAIDRLRKKVAGRPPYNRFELFNGHYRKFPDPPQNKNGKVSVNSLGRRYYAGVYPRWIMWDYTRPERLFVNMDFVLAIVEYEKSIKADKIIRIAAEAVMKSRCLKYLNSETPDSDNIVLDYKSKSEYLERDIDINMWEPYKLFEQMEKA